MSRPRARAATRPADAGGAGAAPGYSALVVDDEPAARAELVDLIGRVEWLECVGEAVSGAEALSKMGTLEPDVLFLDIEMPGASGLDVAEEAGPGRAVIFTTAYAQHAVEAFGIGVVDYLLKPFGEARFLQAAGRVRERLDADRRERRERLQEITLDGVPARRVFLKDRGRYVAVDVGAIIRLDADGDYVRICTEGREFLVYERLKDLHARLDRTRFVRIHRGHVVNLEHVRSLVPVGGGRLRVRFRDGSSLVSSRRYAGNLRTLVI